MVFVRIVFRKASTSDKYKFYCESVIALLFFNLFGILGQHQVFMSFCLHQKMFINKYISAIFVYDWIIIQPENLMKG